MNNRKYLFIGLLLSASATALGINCSSSCGLSSLGCSTNCSTGCSTDCSSSCNVSCAISEACSQTCSFSGVSGNYCSSLSCEDTDFRPGFILRPFTTDLTLDNAVFLHDLYHGPRCEDSAMVDWQAVYFHRSSRSKSTGAGLLLGKNTLVINQAGTGDINSLWLGLANQDGDFSTVFRYNPTYKVDGAYLGVRFDLDDCLCNTWFTANAAFLRLKNKLQICETVTNAGTICGITDATEAFNNILGLSAAANNGQMFIDEVQFKLGHDYFFNDDSHLGVYLMGTAPTRRSQTDVTHNGDLAYAHLISGRGSIGAGVIGDWTMWACNDHAVNWMTDLRYRYIFRGSEHRRFDLNNGPLSGAVLQGVNIANPFNSFSLVETLTLPVKVQPRSSVDLWTALHYQYGNHGIEFGYDFFYINREKVSLKQSVPTNIGVLDMTGLATSATANAVISGLASAYTADATFTPITNGDLSFASVTTNRAMSHKFYLALSSRHESCCGDVDLAVGGEYEYASKSQPMLSQWGLFIKSIMNF